MLSLFFWVKNSTVNLVKLNITTRKEAYCEASCGGWGVILGFSLCFPLITVDNTYINFFHSIFNYLKDDYIYLLPPSSHFKEWEEVIVIIAIMFLIVFMEGLYILVEHYLIRRLIDPDSRDNQDRLVEKLIKQKSYNDTYGFSWNMYAHSWRLYGHHLTYRDKFRIFLAANKAQREGKLVFYNYNISGIGQLRKNTQSRPLPEASFDTIDLILRYS